MNTRTQEAPTSSSCTGSAATAGNTSNNQTTLSNKPAAEDQDSSQVNTLNQTTATTVGK